MVTRRAAALAVFMVLIARSARPQQSSGALFSVTNGTVRFWQTNHLSGGTGGQCVVRFGFDGEDLRDPIESLTMAIRVITKAGVDLGISTLSLAESLGGARADRYREGTFSGPVKWPLQDDGALSPLCEDGVRLEVESAKGRQAGRLIDLVQFHQLRFTAFPRVDVTVKQ